MLTAIRNAVGVDEILKVAVDGIGKTLKVTRVAIYMHNLSGEPDKCDFTARAEYRASVLVPSLINTELDLEGSPFLERVLSGEIIDVPDTNQSDPIMRAISVRLGVRAMALAPIRYNGQTVAMISLEQFDHPHVFSQAEMMLSSWPPSRLQSRCIKLSSIARRETLRGAMRLSAGSAQQFTARWTQTRCSRRS